MHRIISLFSVIVLLLLPAAASAQSIPSLSIDEYRQQTTTTRVDRLVYHTYFKNAVFHHDDWDGLFNADMDIWAHSDIWTDVYDGIGLWANTSYWHDWHWVQWHLSRVGGEVDIAKGDCGNPTVLGCYFFNSYYNINPHNVAIAQYWDIFVTDLWLTKPRDERLKTIAHEFGHVLGRGEMYDIYGNCGNVY